MSPVEPTGPMETKRKKAAALENGDDYSCPKSSGAPASQNTSSSSSTQASVGRTSQNQTCVCTTLYDYEAQGDDELSLRHGEIIEVLSQDVKISGDEGWWTGKINGKFLGWHLPIEFCGRGPEH
ncbi:hypothetical protein OTU49_009260 [Cherax quadricarinatus]|uniref:SH3 domain-containing protein n=1 Tax=Cherax quadricarinatus TaxID=27406 RepID=A0AAW0WLR8_CHEQU